MDSAEQGGLSGDRLVWFEIVVRRPDGGEYVDGLYGPARYYVLDEARRDAACLMEMYHQDFGRQRERKNIAWFMTASLEDLATEGREYGDEPGGRLFIRRQEHLIGQVTVEGAAEHSGPSWYAGGTV